MRNPEDYQVELLHKNDPRSPYANEPQQPEPITHRRDDFILLVSGCYDDFVVGDLLQAKRDFNLASYAEEFDKQVTDVWSEKMPDGTTFSMFLQNAGVVRLINRDTVNISPDADGFNPSAILGMPKLEDAA